MTRQLLILLVVGMIKEVASTVQEDFYGFKSISILVVDKGSGEKLMFIT